MENFDSGSEHDSLPSGFSYNQYAPVMVPKKLQKTKSSRGRSKKPPPSALQTSANSRAAWGDFGDIPLSPTSPENVPTMSLNPNDSGSFIRSDVHRKTANGHKDEAALSRGIKNYRGKDNIQTIEMLSDSEDEPQRPPQQQPVRRSNRMLASSIDDSSALVKNMHMSTDSTTQNDQSQMVVPRHPSERLQFLFRPVPTSGFKCIIHRRSRASFSLYPMDTDRQQEPLIVASRTPVSKKSKYSFSLDESHLKKGSDSYIGKLRANVMGTEFSFCDSGRKASTEAIQSSKRRLGFSKRRLGRKKRDEDRESHDTGAGDDSDDEMRKELGMVVYARNLSGEATPRKMTVLLPSINSPTFHGARSIRKAYKRGAADNPHVIVFANLQPEFNPRLNVHTLPFRTPDILSSVRNFLLAPKNDPHNIVLEFGRTGPDSFIMHCSYPLSLFQAFAICTTSLDDKLGCA